MYKCQSCGGSNPPQAMRCEYCDQALENKKLLEVAWSLRTPSGATGEGCVEVLAPPDADPDRVRALVSAAFCSSVEALGVEATVAQLQADMEPRLRSLLPADHPLSSLEVTAFSAFVLVAEAPAPERPRSGGSLRFMLGVAFMASLCCVFSGPLCVLSGYMAEQEVELVSTARVVPLAKLPLVASLDTQGVICIEGAVAQVDSGILVPGAPAEVGGPQEDIVCLFVTKSVITQSKPGGAKRQVSTTRSVSSFRLGELEVKTPKGSNLKWLGKETFIRRVSELEAHRFWVIRAGEPVTVVGTISRGELTGRPSQRLYVSGASSQAALRRELQLEASAGTELGYIALVLGGLAAFLTFFLRRRL